MIAETFKMKKLKAIALAGFALALLPSAALAAGGQKDAKHIGYSFEGAVRHF